MNQWAFFDEIKAGTVRNVYCFYGPEAYIRRSALETLRKKVLMPGLESVNETVLSAPSAQQIVESCETLPMMSDYRLIIVRDCALTQSAKAKDEAQESAVLCEYLTRVPETTCLLFELGDTLDKRKKLSQALLKLPGAVSFDALTDEQMERWMTQTLRPLQKRMNREACEALTFTSGRDLTLLFGELQKLAAYVGERQEITAQDVEQIATHTAECTVFAMVDAISEGRAQQAFTLLNVLLQGGEQRIGILAMITRHYRQMMHLCALMRDRIPQAQQAKLLGVPPFSLNRLARQVGKRPYDKLRACLEACVQADYDIKRGALREDAALERLMLWLLESR